MTLNIPYHKLVEIWGDLTITVSDYDTQEDENPSG